MKHRDSILCLGPTPAAQRVMVFRQVTLDAVNRAVTTLECAAGKSVNVARVLKVLGLQPVACGFLGGSRGAFLEAELGGRGIALDFIHVAAPTRQCLTVIDDATGMHTELVEESRPVPAAAYADLEAVACKRLGGCGAMILSGSLTPDGPTDFYAHCVQRANAADAISVVDAQGPPLIETLKAKPGLVKPNRSELASTVGCELPDEDAVLAGMRKLRELGAQRVVVTAGKQPALAFDGHHFWRVTAPTVVARNPIGSGDAFTAGLVWRLLRDDDLGEACRWGCAAGTANALTLLPGEVERAEVERLVSEVKLDRIA